MNYRYMKFAGASVFILLGTLFVILCYSTYCQIRQKQLNHALIVAIKACDSHKVASLLKQKADPNTCDVPLDARPIWRLIFAKFFASKTDTKVNASCTKAIQVALQSNTSADRLNHRQEITDIVRNLVKEGADMNAKDDYGMPIHIYALHNTACLQFLLDRGADINAETRNGMSLLLAAIKLNDVQATKLLLSRGAKCQMYGEGISAIQAAQHYDNCPEMLTIVRRFSGAK